MTNKSLHPLDSRKKWQVTLIILFCVVYPFLAAKAFALEHIVLKAAVSLGPPVVCIFVLPYKLWVRAIVAAFYLFLMIGALQAQHAVPCDGCG